MTAVRPEAEIVAWVAFAFCAWVLLIAPLRRLNVRQAPAVAALLSWLVAGLLVAAIAVASSFRHLLSIPGLLQLLKRGPR